MSCSTSTRDHLPLISLKTRVVICLKPTETVKQSTRTNSQLETSYTFHFRRKMKIVIVLKERLILPMKVNYLREIQYLM